MRAILAAGLYVVVTSQALAQCPPVFSHWSLPDDIVVTGDVDGDLRCDIICEAPGEIVIRYGDGLGRFVSPINVALPVTSDVATLADVNADGGLDLLLGSYLGLSVSLNDGLGAFLGQTTYAIGGAPTWVGSHDVTLDGQADVLVVMNDVVGVLVGNGQGQVTSITMTRVAPNTTTGVICDVNDDGLADVVTAGGSVTVVLGRSDGTLSLGVVYPLVSATDDVYCADINEDGNADVITEGAIMLGDGSGGFGSSAPTPFDSSADGLRLVDMNQDGDPELVTWLQAPVLPRPMAVYPGGPAATFGSPVVSDTLAATSYYFVDANNDDRPDLLASGRGISLGVGQFGFQEPELFTGSFEGFIDRADLNNDGVLDVVSTAFIPDEVSRHLGAAVAGGSYSASEQFPSGPGAQGLGSGDFTSDGNQDVFRCREHPRGTLPPRW